MQNTSPDETFQCQYPTEAQLKRYQIIQEAAKLFAKVIRDNVSGSEQQEALRLIRQTIITANASFIEEYLSDPKKVLKDELQLKLKNQIDLIEQENLEIKNIILNVFDFRSMSLHLPFISGINSCVQWFGINIRSKSDIPKGIAQIFLKNNEERIIKFY